MTTAAEPAAPEIDMDPNGRGWEFHPAPAIGGLVGLVVAWAFSPFLVATIVMLLLLITAHELGHLVVARRAGMDAPEFSVGFGPTILAVRGPQTRWALKALPLGGYVRIIGMSSREEIPAAQEPRAYRSRPTRWKIAVSAAGPAANLVLALVALTTMLAVYGPARLEPAPVIGDVAATLGREPSPAARAQLVAGDRIVTATVEGRTVRVRSWDQLVRLIAPHSGDPITLTVRREGQIRRVTVTPVRSEGRGRVGIGQAVVRHPVSLAEAGSQAVSMTGRAVAQTYVGIGHIFGGLGEYLGGLGRPTGIAREHRMISVVGASSLAESAAQHGLAELLALAAMINIAVAAFNLLPVLPFDGGHIVVASVERLLSILRRRETTLSPTLLSSMSAVVLALVMFLGLSALYLDIVAPMSL